MENLNTSTNHNDIESCFENESVFDGKEISSDDKQIINAKTCHGCGGTFLFALSLIF